MSRLVFVEPTAQRDRWLATTEPRVAWFAEVTRPEAIEGRRIVNDLYSRFPDADGRMLQELRSTDDRRLYSALDELLVHDLLARSYRVVYEEGTGRRPDFRLYRNEEYVGAVEVLSLFQREEWSNEERRHGELFDEINRRLPLTTHSLSFDIRRWDDTPSVRHIVRWLEGTIAALRADPEAYPVDFSGTPERIYTSRAVEIAFQMWALQPGYEISDNERIVLGGPAVGGLIDSAERLRDRLETKAVKYDLREKPFAIVVGARDSWCDVGEIHEALTGTPAVVVATGESTRCGNGFYGLSRDRPEGKNPQVSAVFALHHWFPGGPYQRRFTRFDNPFATLPFPDDALPYGGHWGVRSREGRRTYATWLAAPEGRIDA